MRKRGPEAINSQKDLGIGKKEDWNIKFPKNKEYKMSESQEPQKY